MITLDDLKPAKGSRKARKRVGRGPGSGRGKTATRGSKGQKARSGGGVHPMFEGGQMPLVRRVPKVGFTNIFKVRYNVINVRDLNRFDPNSEVDPALLREIGLVKKRKWKVKLLGNGDVDRPITVKVHKASRNAVRKVEAAGGRVEVM